MHLPMAVIMRSNFAPAYASQPLSNGPSCLSRQTADRAQLCELSAGPVGAAARAPLSVNYCQRSYTISGLWSGRCLSVVGSVSACRLVCAAGLSRCARVSSVYRRDGSVRAVNGSEWPVAGGQWPLAGGHWPVDSGRWTADSGSLTVAS